MKRKLWKQNYKKFSREKLKRKRSQLTLGNALQKQPSKTMTRAASREEA